eukprot:2806744-Pleurochrysis_carterae.AAC.1
MTTRSTKSSMQKRDFYGTAGECLESVDSPWGQLLIQLLEHVLASRPRDHVIVNLTKALDSNEHYQWDGVVSEESDRRGGKRKRVVRFPTRGGKADSKVGAVWRTNVLPITLLIIQKRIEALSGGQGQGWVGVGQSQGWASDRIRRSALFVAVSWRGERSDIRGRGGRGGGREEVGWIGKGWGGLEAVGRGKGVRREGKKRGNNGRERKEGEENLNGRGSGRGNEVNGMRGYEVNGMRGYEVNGMRGNE